MGDSFAVTLDSETRARLQSLGRLRDRSSDWVMKTAILEYLDREETYEREKREDQERWERYKMSDHAVPQEAVKQWLDGIGTASEFERQG
jgi:predicted transcriptional regulator